jgi:dethiobiotin synthetase/adenosylmethionine--8-amino-7-oxononanoate aminotransferase
LCKLSSSPCAFSYADIITRDPLFQQALARVVRRYQFHPKFEWTSTDPDSWSGLPVVFDEVFTGLYRLGRFSSASFLQTHPDISVHAKLLTGGLLPLSATLASDSIFDAFWGDEKSDALLHGHSYTAHPIGCHVANTSLNEMRILSSGQTWTRYRKDWEKPTAECVGSDPYLNRYLFSKGEDSGTWSMWSKSTVETLSHYPRVDHVVALGSVLAVSLKDQSGSGILFPFAFFSVSLPSSFALA